MLDLPPQIQSLTSRARYGPLPQKVGEMLAELKGECPAPIDEVTFVCSLRIEDKVSGGLIPFALWDCQIDLLKRLD